MTTTVTNEMLARILSTYNNSLVKLKDGGVCKLVSTNNFISLVSDPDCIDAGMHEPNNNLQLVLIPISEIENEDAELIYEIIIGKPLSGERLYVSKTKTETNVESIYNDDQDDKTNVFIPHSLEIYYTQEGKINEVDGVRMQEIIDFLRSRSYDCGFANIPSLIEAGVAVKKTN